MSHKQTILKIISDNASKTGNMTGISTVQISQIAGLPFKETTEIIDKVCQAGEVDVREGINCELIFGI